MNYLIQNEFLEATFKAKGAELCGMLANGTQYIWQADPTVWARHAPILFPIVGRLENDQYAHKGKTYQMLQHGFARDLDFEVFLHEKDKIGFRLISNQTTLQNYPFAFVLEVFYQLTDRKLAISYQVRNPDPEILYFSIGAHPAFLCPLEQDLKRSDYRLVFEKTETAERFLLQNGNYTGKTELGLENGILPLNENLFEKDALVFKNLASQKVTLADPHKDIFTFYFKNFPYFAVWSKNSKSEFICLEPWFGLSDSVGKGGEISQKEGIIALQSGQIFECEYGVEIL